MLPSLQTNFLWKNLFSLLKVAHFKTFRKQMSLMLLTTCLLVACEQASVLDRVKRNGREQNKPTVSVPKLESILSVLDNVSIF